MWISIPGERVFVANDELYPGLEVAGAPPVVGSGLESWLIRKGSPRTSGIWSGFGPKEREREGFGTFSSHPVVVDLGSWSIREGWWRHERTAPKEGLTEDQIRAELEDDFALETMAFLAARYDGKGQHDDPLPKDNGQFNHDKIAGNVLAWVADVLAPDTRSGRELRYTAVPRKVAEWFRKGWIGPQRAVRHQLTMMHFEPTADGKLRSTEEMPIEFFVCIEHAQLAAALFRKLGYYVQDVNVIAGVRLWKDHKQLKRRDHIWTYQSASVRVWFNGRWNYIDAFLRRRDLDGTILITVTNEHTRMIRGAFVADSDVDLYRYAVYVSYGHVKSHGILDNQFYRGPWHKIEWGIYQRDKGLFGRQRSSG